MKALGADIKEFWDHHFPEGYYSDDTEIETHSDDGDWILVDTEKYDLYKMGVLVPENPNTLDGEILFSTMFSRWNKSRKVVQILVEVPVAERDKAVEYMKSLGWKVKA